jgi:hypothetical protein
MTAFLEQLKQTRERVRASNADTWRLRLDGVCGKVGYDEIERVGTQMLFDLLQLPQRARNAGACRRLAKLMRELGWSPIKARGLSQNGFRDQVRGWARDRSGKTLF